MIGSQLACVALFVKNITSVIGWKPTIVSKKCMLQN